MRSNSGNALGLLEVARRNEGWSRLVKRRFVFLLMCQVKREPPAICYPHVEGRFRICSGLKESVIQPRMGCHLRNCQERIEGRLEKRATVHRIGRAVSEVIGFGYGSDGMPGGLSRIAGFALIHAGRGSLVNVRHCT